MLKSLHKSNPKSDAKTHRTPKALRAKRDRDAVRFRASSPRGESVRMADFWTAHASPRRFSISRLVR
jgi:hypothetical protein